MSPAPQFGAWIVDPFPTVISEGIRIMRPSIGRAVLGAFLLFANPIPLPSAQASPACSDVALVLAIDVSASVSSGEFLLEKRGIASAFRDPSVQRAIRQAGSVQVSAVFWGGDKMPKTQTEWVAVDVPTQADRFAHIVETTRRPVTGDTGLGAGMASALARLTSSNVCATRKIINLSGDGRESPATRGEHRAALPARVRDMASKEHVEINALSISTDDQALADYFAQNVITGPNAFVLNVRNYREFSDAIRRKLIREISPPAVASLP